jgi:hypothetical protein
VAFQTLSSDLLCSRRCASHERDINLVWDVYTVDEHDADDDLFLRIHREALPVRAPLRGEPGTCGR